MRFLLFVFITLVLNTNCFANMKNIQEEKSSIKKNEVGGVNTKKFINPIDNPNLPNVLLIGDSISMGYTKDVGRNLKGIADVYRIRGNSRDTKFGIKKIDEWLSGREYDVIHFNWGLWDLAYRLPTDWKKVGKGNKVDGFISATPSQYEYRLRKLVAKLKQTNSTLIWASTTPTIKNPKYRDEGSEIIYNEIAAKIMKENNIKINDLHSFVLKRVKRIKDDPHYDEEGSKQLAKKVSKEIFLSISKK